ncbi:MAG: hypothetical protein QY311_01690 [Candidatus Paceibacterota bacterium]|nr:MAG: hypothetical protein QY311_01690 [Candidatus Paceibacterota bacterium]
MEELRAFARECRRRPALSPLWELLWGLSYDPAFLRVRGKLLGELPGETHEREQAESAFNAVRLRLEAVALAEGILIPDLSWRVFADQHLQYNRRHKP